MYFCHDNERCAADAAMRSSFKTSGVSKGKHALFYRSPGSWPYLAIYLAVDIYRPIQPSPAQPSNKTKES